MTLSVSITEQQIFTVVGNYITATLGVPAIQLPTNRASMPPPDPGFVGMRMRPDAQSRIMTNIDSWDRTIPNPDSIQIEQAVKVSMMLECYGVPAFDWAVILSTTLRDEYGVNAFAAVTPLIVPLYADDPKFAPLVDGEAQYESRYLVNFVLQYNPVVSTPMQFADTIEFDLINVDERYPP